MTPSETVRAAFPRWQEDPYQRVAVYALLRIVQATERVEDYEDELGESILFFLSDPPLSLSFDQPARAAANVATRLEALASEIRRGLSDLRGLQHYVDQYDVGANNVTEGEAQQAP